MLNRNKKSVTLDLKIEGDREKCALSSHRAGLHHNVRTSAMGQLGFGYEQVAAINPSMVYVHLVGFGSDDSNGTPGVRRPRPTASGGADMILDNNGEHDAHAELHRRQGLWPACAGATLAALFHRERTGGGQFVEVPMLSYALPVIEHLCGAVPAVIGRHRNAPAVAPDRACFKTKDGWIATMPSGKEGANNFMKLGGVEDFYNSEEFVTAKTSKEKVALYNAAMRKAAATHTTAEWMELGQRNRIPIMRANTLDGVLDDPHLKAVSFFRVLPHEARTVAFDEAADQLLKAPTGVRDDPRNQVPTAKRSSGTRGKTRSRGVSATMTSPSFGTEPLADQRSMPSSPVSG